MTTHDHPEPPPAQPTAPAQNQPQQPEKKISVVGVISIVALCLEVIGVFIWGFLSNDLGFLFALSCLAIGAHFAVHLVIHLMRKFYFWLVDIKTNYVVAVGKRGKFLYYMMTSENLTLARTELQQALAKLQSLPTDQLARTDVQRTLKALGGYQTTLNSVRAFDEGGFWSSFGLHFLSPNPFVMLTPSDKGSGSVYAEFVGSPSGDATDVEIASGRDHGTWTIAISYEARDICTLAFQKIFFTEASAEEQRNLRIRAAIGTMCGGSTLKELRETGPKPEGLFAAELELLEAGIIPGNTLSVYEPVMSEALRRQEEERARASESIQIKKDEAEAAEHEKNKLRSLTAGPLLGQADGIRAIGEAEAAVERANLEGKAAGMEAVMNKLGKKLSGAELAFVLASTIGAQEGVPAIPAGVTSLTILGNTQPVTNVGGGNNTSPTEDKTPKDKKK